MKFLVPIIKWYERRPFFQFALVNVLSSLTLQLVFAIALYMAISHLGTAGVEMGGGGRKVHEDQDNPVKFLILSVLFAPLVETYIFQQGVTTLLRKVTNKKSTWILISSVIFGAIHFRSSMMKGMQAFFSGLVFATAFVVWLDKTKNQKQAYAVTCLSHMLHNFAYLVMSYIPASVIFGAF